MLMIWLQLGWRGAVKPGGGYFGSCGINIRITGAALGKGGTGACIAINLRMSSSLRLRPLLTLESTNPRS